MQRSLRVLSVKDTAQVVSSRIKASNHSQRSTAGAVCSQEAAEEHTKATIELDKLKLKLKRMQAEHEASKNVVTQANIKLTKKVTQLENEVWTASMHSAFD